MSNISATPVGVGIVGVSIAGVGIAGVSIAGVSIVGGEYCRCVAGGGFCREYFLNF